MINDLYQCLLSFVCITFPEHVFFVIMALKFMGRKDMLDLYNLKENFYDICKIVIPSSLTINILEYIIKTPSGFNKLVTIFVLYIMLVYILKTRSYIGYSKLYQKTFGFLALSILFSVVLESFTYPIVTKLVGMTYEQIKLDFYLVVISSFSVRIVNIIILVYLFVNKHNKFQVKIVDYIFNNNFFRRLVISSIIVLAIFETYIIKLVIYNNLLNVVQSIYEQLILVTVFTFLLPSLLLTMIYLCINYCVMIINTSEKQNISND